MNFIEGKTYKNRGKTDTYKFLGMLSLTDKLRAEESLAIFEWKGELLAKRRDGRAFGYCGAGTYDVIAPPKVERVTLTAMLTEEQSETVNALIEKLEKDNA